MKQQFLKEKADTIRLTVYESNRPIVPDDSVKITLYTSSGAELQAQTSASRDATTGEMAYTISATHSASHNLNYKALWEYTYSGVTYYESQLFDVVKSILSIPITDDDIYDELEALRTANLQYTGTATAGAAGSLTDTGVKDVDDYWKGGTIEIIAGTGVGQKRTVTGFTQSTSVLAVTPDFGTNPSTDSDYIVVKSFSNKIQQAFEKVETMIYNKGRRHSLILESSQIMFPVLYSAISSICMDLFNEDGDKWHILALDYKDMFEKSFGTMKVDYDADESGSISAEERQTGLGSLNIGRS